MAQGYRSRIWLLFLHLCFFSCLLFLSTLALPSLYIPYVHCEAQSGEKPARGAIRLWVWVGRRFKAAFCPQSWYIHAYTHPFSWELVSFLLYSSAISWLGKKIHLDKYYDKIQWLKWLKWRRAKKEPGKGGHATDLEVEMGISGERVVD